MKPRCGHRAAHQIVRQHLWLLAALPDATIGPTSSAAAATRELMKRQPGESRVEVGDSVVYHRPWEPGVEVYMKTAQQHQQ